MEEKIEMKKKEFKFQGKELAELKSLDVREFAKLLRARPRRTILRNFQKLESFINRSKIKIQKNKNIKTHSRDLIVVPEMIGWKISIHSGNKFNPVEITGEMLGHVFGEFAPTRAKIQHSKSGVGEKKENKKKKKKKKRKKNNMPQHLI